MKETIVAKPAGEFRPCTNCDEDKLGTCALLWNMAAPFLGEPGDALGDGYFMDTASIMRRHYPQRLAEFNCANATLIFGEEKPGGVDVGPEEVLDRGEVPFKS